MSQYDTREPFEEPKNRVAYIKKLLAKKAMMDFLIDSEIKLLTDKERQELYIYQQYQQ